MSSFDKTVKLACKPKAAPPKAKYLDPIVAATWADEGSVSDVCRALAPRFREPNAIVVFKALIVLHTIIRNGSTDNVLSYLSSSDVLRLRNVSAGSWDGYAAPQNLQHYAIYLDMRIRAYRELKHDAIRVQAENNRDLRNSMSIEEESYRGRKQKQPPKNNGPQRSKTIMGRKLGSMPVEKGLLKETRMVQKMIDALVECRFYLDDLEDQLTIYALRMLVRDLLILVQACNEGVINVLENYFEMPRPDARQALELYRHFCKQTGHVDEYLGVAKKLQNLLNVSIPSLKSAPNSLASALQEYLDDPNFEQNRREYKTAKTAAEQNVRNPMPTKTNENQSQNESSQSSSPKMASTPSEKNEEKSIIDFFAAIEEERPNMQANSVVFGPGPHNPFSQWATHFAMQPTGQILPQHTAIPQILPQHTIVPSLPNAFESQSLQSLPGQPPLSSLGPSPTGLPQSSGINLNQGSSSLFSQQQITGLPQQQYPIGNQTLQQSPMNFPTSQLRPQATGLLQPANPFRQSTFHPQNTGVALFGVGAMTGSASPNPFNTLNTNTAFPQSQSAGAISTFSAPSTFAPAPSFGQQSTQSNLPIRPASTPLTSLGQTPTSITSPPQAQTVQTHQTGSKNPFGPVIKTPPPIPKAPTLLELATSVKNDEPVIDAPASQLQVKPVQNVPVMNTFPFTSSALDPGASDMSSVASSFSMKNRTKDTNGAGGISGLHVNLQNAASSSLFSSNQPTDASSASSPLFSSTLFTGTSSTFTSSMSSSQTSASSPMSSSMTSSPPQVKSHITGFAGLKPFKPTSSFGAALIESLPPIPDNAPAPITTTQSSSLVSTANTTTPSLLGTSSQQPGLGMYNTQQTDLGGPRTQSTGALVGFSSTTIVGQGLRPQMTGGASNPFRASMAVPSMMGVQNVSTLPPFPASNGFATSLPSFAAPGMQPMGANLLGSGGSEFMSNTSGQLQPQQQSSQSLV